MLLLISVKISKNIGFLFTKVIEILQVSFFVKILRRFDIFLLFLKSQINMLCMVKCQSLIVSLFKTRKSKNRVGCGLVCMLHLCYSYM